MARMSDDDEMREWTVREAGKKGGETTRRTHGPAFYHEIGLKGGRRVKKLIEEGKRAEMMSKEEEEDW